MNAVTEKKRSPDQTVTIRPATHADRDSIQRYFGGLNPESLYRRLFATSYAVPELFYTYLKQENDRNSAPDQATVIALIAEHPHPDKTGKTLIGEAMMSIDPQSGTAEFGLSISEQHRRQGVGEQLLKYLLLMASRRSVELVYADALRNNTPLINLAKRLGFTPVRHPEEWSLIRLSRPIQSTTSHNAA